MKKIATLVSIIIGLAVIGSTVDNRYGLAKIQAENTADIKLIRLERQEEVFQKRYFDLVRQYGPFPTHEQKIEIEKAKVDWGKKKKKVDKALGIKDD